MIPPFDDSGNLPPGIHPATLDEIEARFGRQSEIRRAEMDSIRWMTDLARRAGVERTVLNGSFVTAKIEPNDVDCALLLVPGARRNRAALKELRAGLPYLDIALVNPKEFDRLTAEIFAADRFEVPKGMVEVIL